MNEHNPDNLTPEQVGEGWRLLMPCERIQNGDQYWAEKWFNLVVISRAPFADQTQFTYRRRVSPPSPVTDATAEQLSENKGGDEPCAHKGKSTTTPASVAVETSTTVPVGASNAPVAVQSGDMGQELSRLRAELAEARRDRERLRQWIHGKVKYLRGLDNKYGYTLTGDDPLYETADQAIDAVVSQPEAKEGQ